MTATIGSSPLRFAESTKPPTSVRRQPVDSEIGFFETNCSFFVSPLTATRSAYDEAGTFMGSLLFF